MGAFPVDLPTSTADMEFIEILFGQRFETVEHLFLANRLKLVIAAQTAVEGNHPRREIKSLYNLVQLLERIERSKTIPSGDRFSHKQTAVTAEKNTLFSSGDLC
jgi:hypothetical protein